MNSIDMKTEKANAIIRYHCSFQNVTNLFRFIEFCIFLILISTFSSQLPFSVTNYFKQISFAGINPKFVFVIGNLIILILLYKSRVPEDGDPYGKIDVYDECVRSCVKSAGKVVAAHENEKKICSRSQSEKMTMMTRVECRNGHGQSQSQSLRKLVLKDVDGWTGETSLLNRCRSESEKVMRVTYNNGGQSHQKLTSSVTEWHESQLEKMMSQSQRKLMRSVTERKMLNNVDSQSQRNVDSYCDKKSLPDICRSQSEKVMRVECQSQRRLRRSVTEGGRVTAEGCEVEELSSEAFRQTVEAFIAKQQRSLRDEELAPVPYVGA